VDSPVLLFDGVCNLCNAVVQFVLKHDPSGRIRFASQQSSFGAGVMRHHQLPDMQTVVLLEGNRVFTRSDAALRLLHHLPAPWRWLAVFRVVPRGLRDLVYDFVARNRYRWFGKQDACWLPRAEWKTRFLDQENSSPPVAHH
jgi:predicted DCC family thiol-disulfide oxidoreductase YuxK